VPSSVWHGVNLSVLDIRKGSGVWVGGCWCSGTHTTVLDFVCDKADGFYEKKQLLPEDFVAACRSAGQPVVLRMQAGYDHSYYFISTFAEDHIAHHATYLNQ
jgi:S-formylglutathione hydrolase